MNRSQGDDIDIDISDIRYYCQMQCGVTEFQDPTDPFMVYNRILLVYVLPCIAGVGFLGNLVSLWTFTQPDMVSSTNCYLAALAGSDICLLITSIFMFTFETLRHTDAAIQRVYLQLIAAMYPLGCIAQTCSVYYCVSADFDCFFRECVPCLKRYLARVPVAKASIVFTVVLSIAYNGPHWMEVIVTRCIDLTTNLTRVEVCASPLRVNPEYHVVYYVYLYTVIMVVGPLLILIILTSIIVLCLFIKKRRKHHRPIRAKLCSNSNGKSIPKARSSHSVDGQSTRCKLQQKESSEDGPLALIMVVLLFIVCNTLSLIVNFLETFTDLGEALNYLVDGSNLLVVVNSSVNVFLYILFDTKFRRTVRKAVGIAPVSPVVGSTSKRRSHENAIHNIECNGNVLHPAPTVSEPLLINEGEEEEYLF